MVTMRRTLYLLRHAKSSWSDEHLDDHDRPLAPRGEEAVARLRHYVEGEGVAPELVLCSSARRTVMTLEGLVPVLPDSTVIAVEDGLYGASSAGLLRRLHDVDDNVSSVMLIGHNPGLEMLAIALTGSGDGDLRRRLDEKFPTGALAVLGVTGRWGDLAPSDATLQAFVVPRELHD